jgi:hypothetical protein
LQASARTALDCVGISRSSLTISASRISRRGGGWNGMVSYSSSTGELEEDGSEDG